MTTPASDISATGEERRETDIHPAAKPFLVLGEPKVKRAFIWVALAVVLINSVLGVVFPQKKPAPWESIGDFAIPGSWAIFGILAFGLMALLAPVFLRLFAKPEDYYGEGGLPDPSVSIEGAPE